MYREFIPFYSGKNSYVVQSAAIKALDILFDEAHRKNLHYVLDSTFANDITINNIKRALKRNRSIFIDFIYLDPKFAWINTKARAITEGRVVPKEVFVDAYFKSLKNIKYINKEFGNVLSVNVIIKENKQNPMSLGLKKFEINVKNIESHLPKAYNTKEELREILN